MFRRRRTSCPEGGGALRGLYRGVYTISES